MAKYTNFWKREIANHNISDLTIENKREVYGYYEAYDFHFFDSFGTKIKGFGANVSDFSPTILFLHGFDRPYSLEFLKRFLDQGFNIITFNYPHQNPEDHSDKSQYYSVFEDIRDNYFYKTYLLSLLFTKKIIKKFQSLSVVGYSQGAAHALLVSNYFNLEKVVSIYSPFINFPRIIEDRVVVGDKFADYLEKYPEKSEEIHKAVSYFDLINILGKVSNPTLLLSSKSDQYCPDELIQELVPLIKNKKLVHYSSFDNLHETPFRDYRSMIFDFFKK